MSIGVALSIYLNHTNRVKLTDGEIERREPRYSRSSVENQLQQVGYIKSMHRIVFHDFFAFRAHQPTRKKMKSRAAKTRVHW